MAPKGQKKPQPSKPRPKRAARRPATQKRVPQQANGLHTMHPALSPSPAPTLLATGRSLCLNGVVETSILNDNTDAYIVACSNVGTTATVMVRYKLVGSTVTAVAFNSEPLSSSATNTLRASKLGTTLVCTSNAQRLGGSVWVLHTSNKVPLPTTPTSTEFTDLAALIRTDPSRRCYSSNELQQPRRWTTHVCDQSDYSEFTAIGATGEAVFEASVDSGGNTQKPMSTLLYYFPATAVSEGQTYNLTCHTQHFVRYALAGVGQSMQTGQPTASAAAINKSRTDVERHGSSYHGDRGIAGALNDAGDVISGANRVVGGLVPWVRTGAALMGRGAPLALM